MGHDCSWCGGPCSCGGDAGPKVCSLCPKCRAEEDDQPPRHDRRAGDADHVDDDDVADCCSHGVPYSEDCEDCDDEHAKIDQEDYEGDDDGDD
jgi:hypothetical protein